MHVLNNQWFCYTFKVCSFVLSRKSDTQSWSVVDHYIFLHCFWFIPQCIFFIPISILPYPDAPFLTLKSMCLCDEFCFLKQCYFRSWTEIMVWNLSCYCSSTLCLLCSEYVVLYWSLAKFSFRCIMSPRWSACLGIGGAIYLSSLFLNAVVWILLTNSVHLYALPEIVTLFPTERVALVALVLEWCIYLVNEPRYCNTVGHWSMAWITCIVVRPEDGILCWN